MWEISFRIFQDQKKKKTNGAFKNFLVPIALDLSKLQKCTFYGLPSGSMIKNPPANPGDTGVGSILELKRSPGRGNGNPLQYSCLKNPMDRGVRWATIHEVTRSQTWLSRHACTLYSWDEVRGKLFHPFQPPFENVAISVVGSLLVQKIIVIKHLLNTYLLCARWYAKLLIYFISLYSH